MKAVMFCSIKGGVGKTMCADEFAFSLDRTGTPYGFVDIDEQQTTCHDGHEDEGAEIAVVDTPARMSEATFRMLKELEADDVVCIVTKATSKDIPTLQDTIEAVRNRTSAKLVYVVNMASRYTIGKEFVDWFTANIEPDKYAVITNSDMVQQAEALDRSIIGYAKNTAVDGVKVMVNLIRRELGIPLEKFD